MLHNKISVCGDGVKTESYLIRNILNRKEIKEHVGTMDKGIALLLFAILLQMCSTGMELLTLLIGVIGLYLVITDTKK